MTTATLKNPATNHPADESTETSASETPRRTRMRDSGTNLPLPDRIEMVALLNQCLADTIDLRLQVKQAHWNVRGVHFQALHELFDDVAEPLSDFSDDIAERAGTLGGVAIGTVSDISKATRLEPMPNEFLDDAESLGAVRDRLAAVANATRAGIDAAAEAGDEITADVLTEVTRGLDQQLWFVESHLDI